MKSPRNKTIVNTETELTDPNIINGDCFTWFEQLPPADLLFLDPPYNMNKTFGTNKFNQRSVADYTTYLDSILTKVKLKPTASIYICGDWLSSISIHTAVSKYFIVRNRITWARDKGRGAKTNWKQGHEDIWFCTVSDQYTFNVDQVKLRRKVLAPYTENGKPKDHDGQFRDTHPSNCWTDLTVPFWSMSENTDHPTQKPEKLLAKIILASSNPGDLVFDPFLGSGTSIVVANKLNRKYIGIEIDPNWCLIAQKRLKMGGKIQGYEDGVFWERNAKIANN